MKGDLFLTHREIILGRMYTLLKEELNLSYMRPPAEDWFTIGDDSFLQDISWQVSKDPKVACLINAINCLQGWSHLIYKDEASCDRIHEEENEEDE